MEARNKICRDYHRRPPTGASPFELPLYKHTGDTFFELRHFYDGGPVRGQPAGLFAKAEEALRARDDLEAGILSHKKEGYYQVVVERK